MDEDRLIDELIIDKILIDEYISSQKAIDYSIIQPKQNIDIELDGETGEHRRDEEYRILNPKTVFTIIFFTSIATLILNPSWLIFTLPASIALSFLLSLASRRKKEEVDESRRVRGDEEWW